MLACMTPSPAHADRRHRARARPRPASPAAHSPTSPRSGCVGIGLLFAVASSSGSGPSSCSTPALPDREPLRLPLLAGSFGLLLVALWAEPRLPGHQPRVHRHPRPTPSSSSSTAATCRSGSRPSQLAGLTPADVTSALHYVLPPAARCQLPAPPRSVRRRHPDPAADHPERRLDRRCVPDASAWRSSCSPPSSACPQELDEEQSARPSASASGRLGAPMAARDRATRAPRPACRRHSTAPVALERPLVMGSAGASLASPPRPSPRRAPPRLRARHRGRVRHRHDPDPAAIARGGRAGPPAPIRPPRAQRLVLGAVGGPAHLAVRRPAQPARARRGRRRSRPGSALATGLVFFAATLPNLLLSPIAGTFVDRWDHKEVMVVSDILRAAIVLVLPLAAVTNIVLVYPLIFLVTSISVFFRPARVAILPQIVPERGPAQRELGAVGRRDDRRRHRLPAGRHLRGAPRQRRPARVLGRQRDLPRVGGAAGHDRRPGTARGPADERRRARARASSPS